MRLYEMDAALAAIAADRPDLARCLQPEGYRCLFTEHTRDALVRAYRGRPFRAASPHTVHEARWRGARERLVFGWSAAVSNVVPDSVVDEAVLWLYTHPKVALEYMGRGRFSKRMPESVFYLDVAAGRRSYAFRILETVSDARLQRVNDTYKRIGEWLNDPEARIVLTLGGGGYRLFAAQAGIRSLEQALQGDRGRIDEVWGSSGGALLGYAFSQGHDLAVIEQLAFLLYHGEQRDLPGLDARTFLYLMRRIAGSRSLSGALRPELTAWVEKVDELCPPHRRKSTRIPFFAVVSNTRWRHPVAFAEPNLITDDCRDILMPCASKEATGASMAVPLLLSPFTGSVPGFESDTWFDGSVVEENPLMLPFTKWQRDRRRDPAGTPKRLKIAMLHLNMRFSESQLVSALPRGSAFRWARQTAELIDLLLDSKTHALIRTLREIEGVEIMTATLNIGRMNFIARGEIPDMVRSGQIIEGWNLEVPSMTERSGEGHDRAGWARDDAANLAVS